MGLVSASALALAQPLERHLLPCPGLEAGPTRTVTRVIDGETVALDDGAELRLMGALAPRASDVGAEPGLWPMEVAARAELRALLLGRTIEIAFGGERTDRHGRLQAHAFWRDAGRLSWAQGYMLEQGLARAYVAAGNRACGGELLAAEREARAARRGLWGEAAYQVRRADRTAELRRYAGSFQVIEGRLVRIAEVRGLIYLNFAADWRRGFSVSVRRSDRGLLGDFSPRPKALTGLRVRVRGWIERRSSLLIDLSSAGLIEVIEKAGETTGSAVSTRPRRPPGQPGSAQPPPLHAEPEVPGPETKPPGLVEAGR
jgi:endonuclease YncB( thermonuclease family)